MNEISKNKTWFEKVFFAAGSSRSRYICSRAVASHPGQTSGNKAIADTNTTHAVNECAKTQLMLLTKSLGLTVSLHVQCPMSVHCRTDSDNESDRSSVCWFELYKNKI
jgi:hypothetical protein